MEIEVLKKEYWSKSDSFILPLTGLIKDMKYIAKSYLFWENYSIEDYYLVVKFFYKNAALFQSYCKDYLFPILDDSSYVTETFDCEDGSIFVLNMSDWSEDIDMILAGKYSKLSDNAKTIIKRYHRMKNGDIPVHIYAVLYPTKKIPFLGDVTPIAYVSEKYGIDISDLKRIGELGTLYDKGKETLKELCGT